MVNKLKIHINYYTRSAPYGGGNAFIKSLKSHLKDLDLYSESPEKCNIIIFNGHHHLLSTIKLKKKLSDTVFIHRLDGPMFRLRKNGMILDYLIKLFSTKCADGHIFQSQWSLNENIKRNLKFQNYAIIGNACNSEIFKKIKIIKSNKNRKIKLLVSSWSDNLSKGTNTLKYLDRNLDFKRFEIKFIGNTNETFRNIKSYSPMNQSKLANEIQNSDIFLFLSFFESYSNMLIEAISCGIPVITRNASSNNEIVLDDRLLFKTNIELINKISLIAKSLNQQIDYKYNIKSISEVTNAYIEFSNNTIKKIKSKKISFLTYGYLCLIYYVIKIFIFTNDKLNSYLK